MGRAERDDASCPTTARWGVVGRVAGFLENERASQAQGRRPCGQRKTRIPAGKRGGGGGGLEPPVSSSNDPFTLIVQSTSDLRARRPRRSPRLMAGRPHFVPRRTRSSCGTNQGQHVSLEAREGVRLTCDVGEPVPQSGQKGESFAATSEGGSPRRRSAVPSVSTQTCNGAEATHWCSRGWRGARCCCLLRLRPRSLLHGAHDLLELRSEIQRQLSIDKRGEIVNSPAC